MWRMSLVLPSFLSCSGRPSFSFPLPSSSSDLCKQNSCRRLHSQFILMWCNTTSVLTDNDFRLIVDIFTCVQLYHVDQTCHRYLDILLVIVLQLIFVVSYKAKNFQSQSDRDHLNLHENDENTSSARLTQTTANSKARVKTKSIVVKSDARAFRRSSPVCRP